MQHEEIVNELTHWMQTFVEVPHPALGGFAPCPYARQARISNKIAIIESQFGNLVNSVEEHLPLLDTKDVLVVWFDHTQIDAELLASLVRSYNKILMPADYVILEDHPDDQEYVSGVKMNFGKCGLLVVQKLNKLNTASNQLKEKGYYTFWNQEAIDEVVTWRYNNS